MNNTQMVHIGMINSFNVLIDNVLVEDVISSGLGVFAHSPDEDTAMKSIEFMIFYFSEHEMYERCNKLKQYIKENFNEDGSYKEECCECDLPEVEKYSTKVKCSICNLRLKR